MASHCCQPLLHLAGPQVRRSCHRGCRWPKHRSGCLAADTGRSPWQVVIICAMTSEAESPRLMHSPSLCKRTPRCLGEILRLLGPQLERVRFVTQCLQTLPDHAHGVSSTYRQSPSPAVRVSLSKSGGTSPVNTALPRASSRMNRIFPCSAFLSEDISSR